MSVSVGVVAVVLGLAGCGLLHIWSAGASAGRKAERRIRRVSRFGKVAGYAVVSGVVIGAVQWATVANSTEPALMGAVLGVPALLAGVTVGRLCTAASLHRHAGSTGTGRPAAGRGVRR
jgi:hypothetical protein